MSETVNFTDTTCFLWDEFSPYGDVILETDTLGNPLASYIMAGSTLLAQTQGGVPTYYLADGQGSTRALVDASEVLTDSYDYDAFGDLISSTGTTPNSYLYTGQQFDDLTGLYSLRARYYDPSLGRFLSTDSYPVQYGNPLEYNRYG